MAPAHAASLDIAGREPLPLNARMRRSSGRAAVEAVKAGGNAAATRDAAGSSMIVGRERVHALIEARMPGAVWLHGPTGAGKTIALRTWLERAARPALWLTLDERHADPAVLFAAIDTVAASLVHARGSALPAFSPEHRSGLSTFARDYFEKLDAALPRACAVVVDDVHLADDAVAPLSHAIDAFGARRPLFFASQLLPGRKLAAQLARSRLWTIGHRQLAFDTGEAHALAARLAIASAPVDALLAATDGWAAGLMLAMQLGPPSSGESGDPLDSLRSPLAHLISTQVLRGVAADAFHRLRVLAELPQVPMDLVHRSDDWKDACAHLDRLADRGLFVERLPVARSAASGIARIAKGCWRLHDLFRSALREAGATRDVDAVLSAELVAHLLALDRLDLAWQLASAGGASTLDALVARVGAMALRDADLPLLREMAARCANDAPRVALWRARALIGADTAAALEACESAWQGFQRDGLGDEATRAASLALFIVFAGIEHVGAIAPWLARFATAGRDDERPDEQGDVRAIRCAAEVMHDLQVGGRASDAGVAAMQDRLVACVVDDVLTPNEAILAGSLAVAAMEGSNRIADVDTAIARIEALPTFARAAPHIRAQWNIENGYHFVRTGSHDAGRRAFAESVRLADENALAQTRVSASIGLVRLELAAGNVAEAREAFARLRSLGAEHTAAQSGLIWHLQARVELAGDEPAKALRSIETAAQLMKEQGFPRSQMLITDSVRMQVLFALRRFDESAALGRTLVDEGSTEVRERMTVNTDLMHAIATWDDARDEARGRLASALAQAERIDQVNFIPLLSDVAARVCAYALQMGVSIDFVKRAIRARRLRAPVDAPSSWPWPVRIEVLGPFAIHRDGIAMRWSGKAQQKPLELLKYLACDRHMTADLHALSAALWPDADESAARKSLEVTVSRLRKLLDDDTLVVVREGRVSLDATRVSSDARELIDVGLACEGAIALAMPPAVANDHAVRILALFHALPLEHDEGPAWREGTRERFRAALVRAVRALSIVLDDAGDATRAIELLEAAVAREPLAEALYQQLMRLYTRIGQPAEAMRTYRQCRQMLSILIGSAPSAETEKLKEAIHQQGTKQ